MTVRPAICSLSVSVVLALAAVPGVFDAPVAAQAGAADPLALAGIAHVAFRVSDVPASRAFYEKLGFEQAFEFGSGATVTSYVKVNDRQFIELYGRASEAQPTGLMHLCFEMGDTERLFDAYVKRGLTPTDKRKARAGNLLFNVRDADGQVVEYTQYLPGSLHSNDQGKHLRKDAISTRFVGASLSTGKLAAEREFFAGKLGFAESGAARLRLAGGSGHEIEIEAATPAWKPRIEFAVDDLSRVEQELRHRGIAVRADKTAVRITDPDGAVIAFLAAR